MKKKCHNYLLKVIISINIKKVTFYVITLKEWHYEKKVITTIYKKKISYLFIRKKLSDLLKHLLFIRKIVFILFY